MRRWASRCPIPGRLFSTCLTLKRLRGINRAAEAQIDAVIEAVRARRTGNMMRHRVPLFASCAYHAIGLPRMQQTSKFAVDADVAASAAASAY